MNRFFNALRPYAQNAFRIVIGFLFMTHGTAKLFGWFGGHVMPFDSRFGIAGILETFGGTLIALGLFTRPVAFVVSGEMAVAFFWMHAAQAGSIWPWINRGELPALYCFSHLLIAAMGPGAFSIDAWWKRRRERRVEQVRA